MADGFGMTRDRYNPRPPLKAKGNLSYLQFIELIKMWWTKAHPDIPLIPMGKDGETAQYPCIVYSLQLRKTHPGEPKMRLREERNEQGDAFIVGGQRFQNIVYFSAVAEVFQVEMLDDLIERFEDFMLEYTPALKECGLSEIVYARRLQDSTEQRPGANVFSKTVSYMVTTEKVITTRENRLTEAVVTARTWLDSMGKYYMPGTIYNMSPRYTLTGADSYLSYQLTQSALDKANSFEELEFIIPKTNFRIGDVLFLAGLKEEATPSSVRTMPIGFFEVTNLEIGEPYDIDVGYTLRRRSLDAATPLDNPDINTLVPGMGAVFFFPQTTVEIEDSIHADNLATPSN